MEQEGLGISSIPQTAVKFISSPSSFYREMPKKGGYAEPLAFIVAMSAVGGILQAALSLMLLTIMPGAGMGATAGMAAGVGAIIMFPIAGAIFGFVGAAIQFVIWKLMGSEEDYETAYRCVAYASALTPVYILVNLIPRAGALLLMNGHSISITGVLISTTGSLISIIISLYIVVTASVEVHKLPARKSWIVFGTIDAVIIIFAVLLGVSTYFMAKKFALPMAVRPAFTVPAAPAVSGRHTSPSAAAHPAGRQPATNQPAAVGAAQPASGAQKPALQQMDATIKAMEDRLNSLPPEQQVQMRRMIDQMKQARAKAASQ